MRPVLDVIRRGFDNVLANWPLLLIRIAETVLIVLVVAIGTVVSILPYIFSGVLDGLDSIDDPRDLLQTLVLDHPFAILFWFLAFSITLLVAVFIHSFVYGGVVGVYLDADRAAGSDAAATRARFDQFTPERWMAHARRTMWPLFWIYNIIWGIAGLVLILPMIGVLVFMIMAMDSPETMVFLACASVAFILLVSIGVSILAYLWSQLAIIVAVRDSLGVRASIGAGIALFRERLGGIVAVAVILFVVSMAIGGVFSGVYFAIGLASAVPALSIATIPLQIGLSLLQSLLSVFTSSWLVAALVAAVNDRP